jgi:hypothetical protein
LKEMIDDQEGVSEARTMDKGLLDMTKKGG